LAAYRKCLTRQHLEIAPAEDLTQLVEFQHLGRLGRGPLVHAANPLQHALHAIRADTAPEVVDLAHRREGVVILPVPHELADALDRRGILWDELDGDRVPDVASVGPWQGLRGVHHLYLDRRRIKREMHRNSRRNLLHQPPSKDVIFGVRLEHRI
jgi:hypothetical protein